jgi:hypothetical protein
MEGNPADNNLRELQFPKNNGPVADRDGLLFPIGALETKAEGLLTLPQRVAALTGWVPCSA